MGKKKRKPRGYWTKAKCAEEAKKYKFRSEFQENSKRVYAAALHNGWLDEVCAHMEKKIRGIYWTKEKCKAESQKYKTRMNFHSGSQSAYNSAHKNGWLNEICAHMEELQKPRGYWTKELCAAEAKKFKTRIFFQKGHGAAYQAAQDKGWLDEICAHMEVQGNLFKRCIYSVEFADKSVYVGLTDNFEKRKNSHIKKSSNKYVRIKIQKKLGFEVIKLTEYIHKKDATLKEKRFLEKYKKNGWKVLNIAKTGALGGDTRIWTKELCAVEAKKHKTRNKFKKINPNVYQAAFKNGWLNEICAHMEVLRKHWSKDECLVEAKKYKFRSEFQKRSAGAWTAAQRHGWLDEVCAHMVVLRKHWSKDECLAEAKKYKFRSEFQKRSRGAWIAAQRHGWLDEVCAHMEELQKPAGYWTKEKCADEAKKYTTRKEFREKCPKTFSAAKRSGWLNEICAHMEVLRKHWSKDECLAEAKKYKFRSEFRKFSNRSYSAARVYGWLDEVCAHMEELQKPAGYWTKKKCAVEAKKYKTRTEFQKGSSGAYQLAHRNEWMDEICKHMKKRSRND